MGQPGDIPSEGLSDDELTEQLCRAVDGALADGPQPIEAVLAVLDRQGLLDQFRDDDLLDEGLEQSVIDWLRTDAFWFTADRQLARCTELVDGLVLTHRLLAAEAEAGAMVEVPDLVVLNREARDGLTLPDGGRLIAEYDDRLGGRNQSVVVGPEGWLDGFTTGDLVSVTRTGDRARVEVVGTRAEGDPTADDQREVAALRQAAENRFQPGIGGDAVPLLMDALSGNRTLFRQPVRPLGELLEAAGLERRGFDFGPAGSEWSTRAERFERRALEHLEEKFELEACCRTELDRLLAALKHFCGGQPFDEASAAAALSHGSVGAAFASHLAGLRPTNLASPDHQLVGFADALVAGTSGRAGAPALLLRARFAEQAGDLGTAEAALRQALRVDLDEGDAAYELAFFELDRGNLGAAALLLRHPTLTEETSLSNLIEDQREKMEAPYRQVGRNDPCPCGSGRKFKLCCNRLDLDLAPLRDRTALIMMKLNLFISRPQGSDLLSRTVLSACDPDDPEVLKSARKLHTDPNIADFAIWEGGGAERYVKRRGALLPDDERALIVELAMAPRQLFEIVAVEAKRSLTLRDTATGEVLVVDERLGSESAVPGQLLLMRVARLAGVNQIIGSVISIPLQLRQSTLRLVDSSPDADELAAWYGAAIAPPRLANREDEPLGLCEITLATALALDQLRGALDPVLTHQDGGRWDEMWTLPDGESILRGTVMFSPGMIRIRTNSADRADRLLEVVTRAVPDAEVMSDVRRGLDELLLDAVEDETGSRPALGDLSEVATALGDFVRAKEVEWIDGEFSALGGLTPRQAMDDPTRREDLEALLRDFDDMALPPGARGLDPGRLRDLLGLDRPG